MNKLDPAPKNITGKQAFGTFVLFFIVVLGTGFCNADRFTDAEWKSKWYWLYATVSLCGLSFFFVRHSMPKVDRSAYWLIPLFLYCLARAVAGQFVLPFLALCTLFFLICYLSGIVIRNRAFESAAGAIAIAALLLASYGIAQQVGLLPSGDHFTVTGNFDNPAGYASMLALSAPFVLYFTFSGKSRIRHAAWGAYVVIGIAIVLSASRTGVLAVAALSLVYAAKRYKKQLLDAALWKKIALAGLTVAVSAGLYLTKQDSADGRLLIWRCTAEMIREKPLTGHGYKSFEARYMLYQAHYFEQHPQSSFALLADNVKHPFNEFLRLTAEFGLIAFILLVLFAARLIRIYLKNKNDESYTLVSALLAAIVFSCFSYPFSYPFTWLIIAFCAGGLPALSRRNEGAERQSGIYKYAFALLSAGLLCFTIRDMYYDNKWYAAMNRSKSGHAQTATSEYEYLYPYLRNNASFIYNYAAELNYATDFDKSAELVAVCEKMLNDYDIQVLKADNYKKQGDLHRAKDCYLLASRMCPGRFMPLYELVIIYDSTNRPDMALKLAAEIADKPVKVPSGTIAAIKMKMKERLTHEQ